MIDEPRQQVAPGDIDDDLHILAEQPLLGLAVLQDDRVIYANAAAAQISGYSVEEVRAWSRIDFARLVHPDDVPFAEARARHRASGEPSDVRYTYRILHKSGEVRWVRQHAWTAPYRGRPATLVAIVDVTEQQLALEQLDRLHAERAERLLELTLASRVKDDFLASMSHELRTPLNGVLGLSEALREGVYGPIDPRQAAVIARIEESGRHLLTLITDILDVAKIDAGATPLELGTVSLDEVCAASLRLVQGAAKRRRHTVALHVRDALATMVADERRLKQMLVNLLSNAVKFTPPGGAVTLEVALEQGGEEVRLSVRDTGIGIAAADIPRLFDRFTQLDASLSREQPGTGMGLALTRRLADLHGGRVEVESTPGAGSVFSLILPRDGRERRGRGPR